TCGRLGAGPPAAALHGVEGSSGAAQEGLRLGRRVDRESHEFAASFQIGEESSRVLMEMQKPNCTAIKGAAVSLLKPIEPPNFIEDWLESVERFRSRVLH
ncbi:hypothetical protein, partial [Candidatus Binatus sp.]|uniref:hypothetical protein n=1 Tax=Candidatus Binatus sp. TaxID=2811406 RepID=UPI003C6F1749